MDFRLGMVTDCVAQRGITYKSEAVLPLYAFNDGGEAGHRACEASQYNVPASAIVHHLRKF